MTHSHTALTRRRFVRFGLALAAVGTVLATGGASGAVAQALQSAPAVQTAPLQLTASATDGVSLTPSQTEGPYFKASSSERTSLIDPGMSGTPLVITGRVLDSSGQPVAGALLDFWQANAAGAYDNSGYVLRGHQFTDANGQYQLETIVPGLYTGRTRHIHVKVQAPNAPILTTQLYFPDEPRNASDGIFNPALVLPIQDTGSGGETATFDFVVRTA
jgi:protocatechuate 3,4-dioxygenase beta subunit